MGVFTGTYTASSEHSSGYSASKAGDGLLGTAWYAATGAPHTLVKDLGSAKVATYYVMNSRSSPFLNSIPTAWTFEGSTDGSTWDVLDTRSEASSYVTKRYVVANTTAYRYYRLNISATGGGNPSVTEFQIGGGTTHKTFEDVVTPSTHADGTPYNMGVVFSSAVDGEVTHLRYYEPSGLTGTVTLRLYGAARAVLASVTHTATSGSAGWRDVALSSPVAITAGTEYMAAMGLPGGWYARAEMGDLAQDIWYGPLKLPRHTTATYDSQGNNGRLGLSSTAFPDGYYGNAIYAVGVVFEEPTAGPPSGSGAGSWGWAGSGSGSSDYFGSGAGVWGWAGSGSGSAPDLVPSGSGAGVWGWAGSGSGSTDLSGSGAGVWGWTGSGSGSEGLPTDVPSGSGAGEWGWVGSGSGTAPAADGGWGWVGSVGAARPAPDVVLEAPVVAPAAIEERPLVRVSHRLVLDQDPVTGEYRGDGTHEIVREVVGVPHLWVDGLDVTYFQDRPVRLGDITSAIPGGSRVASVGFPQVSVLEARDVPWLRPWAPAEISIVRPGGSKIVCFSGHLISEAGGKGKKRNKVEWTLEGDLGAGGHINLKVPVSLPPVDIGFRIPKLLNEIPGRRFHAIAPYESGIPTRKRGSYTDKVTGHVQDLLATAWTPAGNQLTILPDPAEARRYHMGFKDLTPKWTISAAAPGIEVDLMWDWSQVHNAIYGFGSGPDGYAWAGWRFPGFVDYDPPDYPLPAGVSMRVGSSGPGVLTWKARLIEMGWGLSPGSTYASSDVPKVRAFQTERGILVDGVVGPQTWNEVWNLGPRDLVAPERFPLAVLPAVEPYLYSETGRILGPNPDFDPTVGRHETDIAYGAGVTFAEGVADAQIRLARESEPGLVGEIKMTSCPWEGSRWEIQEGDAATLLQWRGLDPLLYVSQKKISWDAREVTLTVDTKARDAMTLVEIIKREREARADPAGRPGAVNRSSRTEQDQVVEFDGESPAGRFPRIAIRQGLWTVWVIPVSQVGRLVEVDFTTDSPVAEFSVALFGKPITANRLAALVGPPLSRDDPFTDAADELTAAGIIEAWGTASQPGGYWAGRKSDGAPLKGRMRERSSTEYVSQIPPWIWVAVGSPVSTHIQGRVKPPPSMS